MISGVEVQRNPLLFEPVNGIDPVDSLAVLLIQFRILFRARVDNDFAHGMVFVCCGSNAILEVDWCVQGPGGESESAPSTAVLGGWQDLSTMRHRATAAAR